MTTVHSKTHYEIAEELRHQARLGGIKATVLCELVWDTFVDHVTHGASTEGSTGDVLFGSKVPVHEINDGGIEMQVPYLLDRGVALETILQTMDLPTSDA